MTTNPDSPDTLVVRRLIPVPREQVFAAWLDPASLAQWMRPGDDITRARAEVDGRVGGKFRIVMVHEKGDGDEHRGEYLAIDPPSLLSFTWISVTTHHRPSVVTVELRERGTSTELILTHRSLPPTKVDAHREGWTGIIQKLEETLTTGQKTG